MILLALVLDPGKLENPDLDLRYVIPELLQSQSNGDICDGGYEYEDQAGQPNPLLKIFLTASDQASAPAIISALIFHQRVLNNNLSDAANLYLVEEGLGSQISLK